MDNIDQKIREALESSDDSEGLFEERNLIAEVTTPFRGRRKWVNCVGLLYGATATAVSCWAGYRFYYAGSEREQLLWGGLCALALVFVVFSKVYFWMEMHTNRILREIKRVELLLLQTKSDKESLTSQE